MQIGSEHRVLHAALGCAVGVGAERCSLHGSTACVDFVPGQRGPRKGRGGAGFDLGAALVGGKNCLCRQQSQPAQRLRAAALGALAVVQRLAQHLVAAADAQHRRAACRQFQQRGLQSGLPQPKQVPHRVFRAGQND